MNLYEQLPRFQRLFSGLEIAFGTGRGEWVKRPHRPEDWLKHLKGEGPGIGIAPLRPDNTVMFAAIDLDEADFEAAREMQGYLPGKTFVESSRSGNAHVWAFFNEPIEAWIPMGIMREACLAAGKRGVEVFPKNYDFSRVKFGNYINLPFHGSSRPIIAHDGASHDHEFMPGWSRLTLSMFLDEAEASLNDPEDWKRRAEWMFLTRPSSREKSAEFGTQKTLHMCAEHILENAETRPLVPGHRQVVLFCLAKQLTNWAGCDHDEALSFMRSVNEASPDMVPDAEVRRILGNAERGQFTSTGCDDPLFEPYAHPDCPIAHGG